MNEFRYIEENRLAVLKRFVAKVETDGECWRWTGAFNSKGYPYLRIGKKTLGAHRISYMLFVGRISKGQSHHRCMNQWCVHPMHLRDVTAEQNRAMQAQCVCEVDELSIPF